MWKTLTNTLKLKAREITPEVIEKIIKGYQEIDLANSNS